ncbi:helix-turn-helix domain-containing protein [Candidatus Micrarchaeota archaeon]|nr:helix-turn-helix domain-containing protein [Candidatus Micrarchaeota archaeon]
MRAYKFRLYPSRVQEAEMLKHLWLAKSLWNELLGHSKKFYDDFGFFPSKDALQLMVKCMVTAKMS